MQSIVNMQMHAHQTKTSRLAADYWLAQGWANFSCGEPHLKKMLQPRAAHSHDKKGSLLGVE